MAEVPIISVLQFLAYQVGVFFFILASVSLSVYLLCKFYFRYFWTIATNFITRVGRAPQGTFLLPLEPFIIIQSQIPEKAMAPHSSTLAWKIPWTEEPGGLPSMVLHRVGHH